MLFDPATAPQLKPWLVRTLEPICDAEPGALADYILALMKHNAPENDMRKELATQLDEFLEKECSAFIDTLFTVLRTKSYLPYAASPPSPSYTPVGPQDIDTGIPIPLDGLISPSIPSSSDRVRKRSIDNDERDIRPSAKGLRISGEGQFSRYSNGGNRSTGGWGSRGDQFDGQEVNGHGSMNGAIAMSPLNGRQPTYRPPDQKRGICRDYYNNGYCARGAFCKYNHGDDAIVPSQIFPMAAAPMPFMPMFSNGSIPFPMGAGAGVAYDPHEAQMDMRPHLGGIGSGSRPHGRAPLLPRMQREDGGQIAQSIHTPGELPVIQDLTPNPPSAGPAPRDVSENFDSTDDVPIGSAHPTSVQVQPLSRSIEPPMDVDVPMPIAQHMNGAFRGAGRGGRGRGHFAGDSHNFHGERRNDKTLVVEKIPDDKLSLDAVNGWFKKFGTVTNVAVDASKAKALVSFSKHEEAYAAWKSEDAVFNNRFVKIFWHRPMDGHGQVGARMLAASAPLVASMATKGSASASVAPPAQSLQSVTAAVPATQVQKTPTPSTSISALATKQRLLEQQIAEQKSLMTKLATATPDEKKEIMTRLRKLGDEMKPSVGSPATSTTSQVQKLVTPQPDDREQKERERLDKELEMHNATSTVEGDAGKSTEDLKVKLERLKAEAVRLGISDTTGEPTYTGGSSYRPYRGRGRGTRGYYRGVGRGVMPRASMKLDNRPKKLLVKTVSPENVQAVRGWYETTGQMESLETAADGDIIVTFRTRSAAEQGLSKGNFIPPIGKVSISWHPGSQPSTTQVTSPTHGTHEGQVVAAPPRSPLHKGPVSPLSRDEEVITSGWGGDTDDGDGMGML